MDRLNEIIRHGELEGELFTVYDHTDNKIAMFGGWSELKEFAEDWRDTLCDDENEYPLETLEDIGEYLSIASYSVSRVR